MRVAFLDFDGVLNSAEWMKQVHTIDRNFASFMERHCEELNPEAVKLVSDFVLEMEASVVISSSWRILHPLEEIQAMLFARGWDSRNPIIDKTPNSKRGWRGEEVNEWLRAHPEVTAHVIFDDDGDFHDVQPLVKTSWDTGITPFHIEIARKMLSGA